MILLLLCSISAFVQTPEEIRKNADELFDDGLYGEANKEYNKISGVYKRDYDWNFRYGSSLLFSSHDKQEAIKYLNYAVKSPSIDKRAYYFLGRAYHLNYQFAEAQKYYEKFKTQASTGQLKDFDVEAQLNGCRFGRKLLSNITDMIVMEKKEINEESFYDLYDMSYIGGNILVTDRFGSKYDIKKGHRAVIHFPKNSPNVFYSSYGEDGNTGLDIYQKKKLPDGSYSLPQKVRGVINTDLDEDYAYMHPNGKYLYFCSKGHNSMGGYDVFRSPYDPKKDSFGPPENLDFAISSPDDDIMYVVDSLERRAYFSSRRESKSGKLIVYEVRVERIPMQIAAIKGQFENTISPSNKEVNIEIEDFSSGRQIGQYNSKSSNGDYFITFPKGGKYKYFITVKGSDVTHYAVVEVPLLKELRPLKQKISLLRDENGEQYVKIENLFDDLFDDPVTVMAEIYQNLSKLTPNAENFDLDSLNDMKATDDIFVENGLNAFSTKDDVQNIVSDKLDDLKEDLTKDKANSNIAYNLAKEKSDQANEKMIELNKLLTDAESTSDPIQKNKLFEEAYNLKKEVLQLNTDAKNLIELGAGLDKSIVEKEKVIEKGEKTLNDIKNSKDGDKNDLSLAVKNNSEFFAENIKDRSHKADFIEEVISEGNNRVKDANKINGELIKLKQDKTNSEKQLNILENKLANTKKKKDKEIIEDQILEVQSNLSIVNDNIRTKEKDYEKMINGGEGTTQNLVRVAKEVGDEKYDDSNYVTELSSNDKSNIVNTVKSNDLTDNIVQAEKILKENGAGDKVGLFASDDKRNGYSLEEWTEEIDKEIKDLRDQLNTTPLDRQKPILEEIKSFEELRENKIRELEVVENDPNEVVSEVDKNQIVDDYEQRVNEINEIPDEESRVQASLELNNEIKEEIINEKRDLNQLLAENPENKNIQNRINNLTEIENEVDEEIEKNKNWLNNNGGIKDTEAILADFDDAYQNKINEIFEIEDEGQRNEEIIALNNSIVEAANERIQELNAIIENDPNKESSIKERKELTEFRDGLESNINKPIIDPVVIDAENIIVKVEEEQILAGYDGKKTEINEISDEFEKRQALNELNQELSENVRKEIKQLMALSNENPSNKNIKKRIDNLKDLDDELNKDILENEQWLKDHPKELSTDEIANVEDVNPNYKKNLNEIIEIDDVKEKNKAIKELNEETIDEIDSRINIIEVQLADDPNATNYKELVDERDQLQNLKNQIESAPEDPLIDLVEIADINVSPTIEDIMPNYQSRLNEIERSTEAEIEKEKNKIDLNKSLVEAIDTEIERLESLKDKDPDLVEAIDKRMNALNNMKSLKADDIVKSELRIKEINDASETNVSSIDIAEEDLNPIVNLEDVFPEYENEMTEIQNSAASDIDKEKNKIALNKTLINNIDTQISELNQLKSDKPEWTEKIDRRISSLENMRTAKENEISLSQQFVDNSTVSTPAVIDIEEVATIDQIDAKYADEMENINLALQDDQTKERNKIELNKNLIAKIDQEIEDLNKLKSNNPDAVDKINKRINSLNNVKTEKLDEIADSEGLLADNASDRPEITIGSLMSTYEVEMAEIKESTVLTEKDKLVAENKLNEDLVKAADNKISDLQEEWEENDQLGTVIGLEIEKLEELIEAKRNEIAQNNELIKKMGGTSDVVTNVKTLDEMSPEDYATKEGQEVLADNAGNLNEIKEIKSEVDELENELDNATSEKDKKKIQAKIDKRNLKLARVENEVITDLADANDQEFQEEKNETQIDAIVLTTNNSNEPDIIDANKKMEEADQLMDEADNLRNEANDEKNPVVANELLTSALEKENKAKNLISEANRIFKMARVVDNFGKDDPIVVTNVPENVEDRESSEVLSQADQIELQSNQFANRAVELRDSANTVKKKYKEAVLIEADEYDKKADELREEANDIREKGNKIKNQEDELLALQIKGDDTNPDQKTTNEIASSNNYKEFFEATNSANENLAIADEIGKEIEELKANQKRKIKAAVVTYQDGGSIEKSLNDNPEIKANKDKINELSQLQEEYKEKAMQDLKNANDILNESDDDIKGDMIALADNNVAPKKKNVVQTQDPLSADYVAPTVLANDIFRKTDDAIYNQNKKIPIDQKTTGLVYKVQVGAFRKALPQDHFKEFAPVSGQKIGNGITRYMAGYFTKENTANDARGQIRGVGYGDAFVVAYCNGEKITIREARAIEAGTMECVGTVSDENFANNNSNQNNETVNNETANNGNNTLGSIDNGTSVEPNNENEKEIVSYYTDFSDAAKANQVEIVKGLFYTVQIGVYTKPVKPATLFNIQPLNSQKMENGNIRYSTGMYSSFAAAKTKQSETIEKGVADAFVTAYFNGERITLAEANKIIAEQGAETLYNSTTNLEENFAKVETTNNSENTNESNNNNSNNTNTTNTNNNSSNNGANNTTNNSNNEANNSSDNNNNETNNNTNNENNNETTNNGGSSVESNGSDLLADQNTEDLGPPYRINLGFFQEGVPVDFTDLLLNNQNEGILSISDIRDNVLYFVGTYGSKSGAEERRDELKERGFVDAVVVSLKEEKEEIVDEETFYPEGVFYRILMGRFENEVPAEYATILLENQELIETEEDIEGTTYLLSTKIKSLDDIEDRLKEFSELGFEEMEIVSYYQYSAIPLLQADKILNNQPIGKLKRYEYHEGVDADPYLYNKDAIYFHVELGRFYKEVPGDFTTLLFENGEENILREETFDEELVFFSENTYSYEEAQKLKVNFVEKGFVDAKVVAFHKYDNISIEKAKKILEID